MRVDIKAPLTKEEAAKLRAGDIVSLTGYIYTGRDAAHKRMVEGFEKTGKFPFDIKDQIIYYVGPSPAKPSDRQALQHREEWTPMRPYCLTTVLRE